MKVMALDIETANYSHEIGGWGKTHMFDPSVVATWDGEEAHIFSKEDVSVEGATVHPLHPRDLGEHLKKHVDAGGIVVGHNIRHYAGFLLNKKESVVDTSWTLREATGGARHRLDTLCKHTLGRGKEIMDSADAPVAWREGRYDEVAKYCLDDCKLNLDLFLHGRNEGFVKSRNEETGLIEEYSIGW